MIGKTKILLTLCVITLVVGSLLLIYMMSFEGEPGAMPLILIVGGIIGLLLLRVKKMSSN